MGICVIVSAIYEMLSGAEDGGDETTEVDELTPDNISC